MNQDKKEVKTYSDLPLKVKKKICLGSAKEANKDQRNLMNQSKYNLVRDKIVESVPGIMELKFGCEYKLFNDVCVHKVDGGNYIVNKDKMKVKIISICNHPKYTKCCGEYQNFDDEPEEINIVEILGRPITLDDVLISLDKKYNNYSDHGIHIDWRTYFIKDGFLRIKYFIRNQPIIGYPVINSEIEWEVGKPLSEQSPETIEGLYNLLK